MSPKISSLAFDEIKEDTEMSLIPALSLIVDRKLSDGRDLSSSQSQSEGRFDARPVAITISGKMTVSF